MEPGAGISFGTDDLLSLYTDGISPHATMFISPVGASSAETGRHKHVLLCH